MSTSYYLAHAYLPDGVASNVRITVDGARFSAVKSGADPEPTDVVLPGIAVPGFANTHSHAFQRGLRGRTHHKGGTFWTWRELMYKLARRITPDNYYRLARAVYAEMVLSGISTVGEFHYLHHQPDGTPYPDPNEMGEALISAAADAGIRLTLLDTCYLAGGLDWGRHLRLTGGQRRFGDSDVHAWAHRFAELQDRPGVRVGAAIHSVRAIPADALETVVEAAEGRPLHLHLSEQPGENEQCLAAYGMTPTALLDRVGALGPLTTAVHATHVTEPDIELLAEQDCSVSLCPTTERDLADGIGPAGQLAGAGIRLTLGSDQNAIIDLIEEARAVEMHERLATGMRGRFGPADLLMMLTGHESLGWPNAGRIEPGAAADLVMLDLASVRTAGVQPAQVLFAASASDVRTVIVGGSLLVQNGRHRMGDVGAELADAIAAIRV